MSKKSSKTAQKKTQSVACCGYDFTLFDAISTKEIRDLLSPLCKKYCFQLEKGEKTDTLHFQGRFSLKIKKRLNEAIKLFALKWQKFHLSITSNENKFNNFYVMKDDTKVEGPFTNENEIFIPLDVLKMKTLYPWQQTIVDVLSIYDDRTVDVVYEKIGNIGKSSLVRYMMCYNDAEELVFCNDFKDIMRMAYDIGPKKIYLVDMPRALSKDKLYQFFAGIEKLKSGYCYDDRYKFQRRLFNRPRICLFTNEIPDLSLLSKDMWKLWEVSDNKLVPYDNETIFDSDMETSDFEIENIVSAS